MRSQRVIEVHRLLASGSVLALDRAAVNDVHRLGASAGLASQVGPGSAPGEVCASADAARHVLLMAEREFATPVGAGLLLDFTGVERLTGDAAREFIAARPTGWITAQGMSPAVRTVWQRTWREVPEA